MTVKESDGFDPLAWMNDDEVAVEEKPENKPEIEAEAIAEVKNEVEEEVVVAAADTDSSVEDVKEIKIDDSIEQVAEDVEPFENSKIILDATLNIQNVTALYDQLLKQLDTQKTIEIDASAVVSIDTATLQLITVLKQSSINLQKEVIIDFPSDEFIESAELLGLSELLEVNQAAAGFF